MKVKKQLNLYPFYDLNGMEDHLQEMAGKGWFIKKPGSLIWTYGKDDPKPIRYGICPAGEIDAYEPDQEELTGSFQDHAESAGWKKAAGTEKIQVFSAEDGIESGLHASPYDRISGVCQASKPWLFVYGIMIFMAVASLLLTVYKIKLMPVELYSSSMAMVLPVVFLMLGGYFLTDLISYFRWKTNAEIGATKKENVGVSFHLNGILKLIFFISAGLLGFGAVTSGENPVFRSFFTWLLILAALFIVFKVVHDLLEHGEKTSERIVFGILNVVVAVCLAGSVLLAMNSIRAADRGSRAILPVKAQELGLTQSGEEVQDLGRSKQSFLLRHSEATQMTLNEDGKYAPVLSYEIVDERMLPVDGMVLNHFLSRMDMEGIDPEDGTEVQVRYESMDPGPWQAVKAWQMMKNQEPGSVYLVLYENRLLELGTLELLSESQMHLIGEKIQ